MNWQNFLSNQWAQTIGSGVVVMFVGWFTKSLFEKGKGKIGRPGKTIPRAPEPPVTETAQVFSISNTGREDHVKGPDAAFSASTVRELWRVILALRSAFRTIPTEGGVIGASDRDNRRRASFEFIKRYDEAEKFLEEQAISIPESIAEDAVDLLAIAQIEKLHATRWPDPFDGSVNLILDQKGWTDFLDGRSSNLKKFEIGADKLQKQLRDFIAGKPVSVGQTSMSRPIQNSASNAEPRRDTRLLKKTMAGLLSTCNNKAAVEFFRQRSGMPTNSNKNALAYRQTGKIHWYVWPTTEGAAVLQIDRFEDDETIWGKELSNPQLKPQTYTGKANLRFDLITSSDFEFFAHIAETKQFPTLRWVKPPKVKTNSESASGL